MTDPTSIRTPQELADAVECAIGLNVDCGGTEGVHQARDAVLDAIRPVWDRVAEYENTINWHTTCTSCARILDSSIRETKRAEQAEQRLRLAHQARRAKEHQLDDIRRALCDIGFMDDDDPYSHADLADVIRQNAPGPATDATPARGCRHAGAGQHPCPPTEPCPTCDPDEDAPSIPHNAGPTIAECAANDRRWWNGEKHGEQ